MPYRTSGGVQAVQPTYEEEAYQNPDGTWSYGVAPTPASAPAPVYDPALDEGGPYVPPAPVAQPGEYVPSPGLGGTPAAAAPAETSSPAPAYTPPGAAEEPRVYTQSGETVPASLSPAPPSVVNGGGGRGWGTPPSLPSPAQSSGAISTRPASSAPSPLAPTNASQGSTGQSPLPSQSLLSRFGFGGAYYRSPGAAGSSGNVPSSPSLSRLSTNLPSRTSPRGLLSPPPYLTPNQKLEQQIGAPLLPTDPPAVVGPQGSTPLGGVQTNALPFQPSPPPPLWDNPLDPFRPGDAARTPLGSASRAPLNWNAAEPESLASGMLPGRTLTMPDSAPFAPINPDAVATDITGLRERNDAASEHLNNAIGPLLRGVVSPQGPNLPDFLGRLIGLEPDPANDPDKYDMANQLTRNIYNEVGEWAEDKLGPTSMTDPITILGRGAGNMIGLPLSTIRDQIGPNTLQSLWGAAEDVLGPTGTVGPLLAETQPPGTAMPSPWGVADRFNQRVDEVSQGPQTGATNAYDATAQNIGDIKNAVAGVDAEAMALAAAKQGWDFIQKLPEGEMKTRAEQEFSRLSGQAIGGNLPSVPMPSLPSIGNPLDRLPSLPSELPPGTTANPWESNSPLWQEATEGIPEPAEQSRWDQIKGAVMDTANKIPGIGNPLNGLSLPSLPGGLPSGTTANPWESNSPLWQEATEGIPEPTGQSPLPGNFELPFGMPSMPSIPYDPSWPHLPVAEIQSGVDALRQRVQGNPVAASPGGVSPAGSPGSGSPPPSPGTQMRDQFRALAEPIADANLEPGYNAGFARIKDMVDKGRVNATGEFTGSALEKMKEDGFVDENGNWTPEAVEAGAARPGAAGLRASLREADFTYEKDGGSSPESPRTSAEGQNTPIPSTPAQGASVDNTSRGEDYVPRSTGRGRSSSGGWSNRSSGSGYRDSFTPSSFGRDGRGFDSDADGMEPEDMESWLDEAGGDRKKAARLAKAARLRNKGKRLSGKKGRASTVPVRPDSAIRTQTLSNLSTAFDKAFTRR
jgi:hypothetical protein